MIDKPRIGYASLGGQAHVHAPSRYLPIVIVPGITGTRLTDPSTDQLVWNPLGIPLGKGPRAFAADYDRLAQVTGELVPDETHGFDETSDDGKAAKRIKHYYHLIPDVYGGLAQSLSTLDLSSGSLAIKPKVYMAGYDWRQDNAKSALRLAEVVEEALNETRERRVIIIAHSMGGLVTRYYCRVLGGESKVHRLYLLGSPTLGAPGAYLNLKNGLPGLYAADIVHDAQSGNKAAIVSEGIEQASAVEGGIINAATSPGGAMGKVLAFTGDLFVVLSLGAQRLLTREDTQWFARQMPSIYQLAPTSIFCRDQKNWLVFDPAATGLPPTGYMIVLPTLFELLADLAGGAFKSFFQPDEANRTAPEATRNMTTLEQRVSAIKDAIKGNTTTLSQEDDQESPVSLMTEVLARIQAAFVDCRSNRQLYSDIYTGLLDIVELRAVCAGNLALAYRFDDALTVNPNPTAGSSPLQFLMTTALLPALAAMPGKLGKMGQDMIADAAKKKPATTYMHPRTTNLYNPMLPVDSGALLVPTDTLSNDDSNLVEWTLIPFNLVMPLLMAIGGAAGFASALAGLALGDGTVPSASSNPDPSQISNPFLSTHQIGPFVKHGDIPADADTFNWLSQDLIDLVPDFLST